MISIALLADQLPVSATATNNADSSAVVDVYGALGEMVVGPANEFIIEDASAMLPSPLRALEEVEVVVVEVDDSKSTTEAAKDGEAEDEDKLPDDLRTLTVYPEPIMTSE